MQLFQPDNLSRSRPEFTPVHDPRLTVELEQLLRRSYSLASSDKLRIQQPVGPNISSENLLIEVGQDLYFIKRKPASEKERLLREARLGFDLHSLSVKVAPVVLTNVGAYVHTDKCWCWAVFEFVDGSYFSGRGRELDSAAAAFARLTSAAQMLFERNTRHENQFLDELSLLIAEAIDCSDSSAATLVVEHRETILEQLSWVMTNRRSLEGPLLPLHLDYHPMNLLMDDGEVSSILDLEHLSIYPVLAGVGFAGYKLIRQTMVNMESSISNPLTRWLDGWAKSFPNLQLDPAEFRLGATYRVLHLIQLILRAFLRNGDDRFLFDLEKQIRSLYEIDAIVTRYGTPLP